MIRDGLTIDENAMANAQDYNATWQVLMTIDDLATIRTKLKAFELEARDMRNFAAGVKSWLFYKLGEKRSRKSDDYDDAYCRDFYWNEIANDLGRAEGCLREAIRTLEYLKEEGLDQVDTARLSGLFERRRTV